MLQDAKLSTKLILGYLAVTLFVVAAGTVGSIGAGRINDMLNAMYDNNLVPIADVANANMAAIYHNRGLLHYVIEADQKKMDAIGVKMDEHKARMNQLVDKYKKTSLTDKEIELLAKFDAAWPVYETAAKKVMAASYVGDNDKAMRAFQEEAVPAFQIADDILSAIVDVNQVLGKKAYDESDVVYADIRNMNIGAIVLGFIASFSLGYFISSRLSRVLTSISERLNQAGTQVSAASEQLSTASQQVSAGSTEAASSLEETVASVSELSSMVQLNATNANQAAEMSRESTKSAESGATEISGLIASMSDIADGSKKIEEIINVIDDIAFQTNLLALNAAVEAARAGEQGKGFAVVADAVRTLAQRSAAAAKDITVLIKETVAKTDRGRATADVSGKVLTDIVTSVKKIAALNAEIASASTEQSTGISQISSAMNELDQATQQNVSASSEVASSAEELSAQALLLRECVSELFKTVNGAAMKDEFSTSVHGVAPAVAERRSTPRSRPTSKPRMADIIPLHGESGPAVRDSDPVAKVGGTSGF